MNFYCVSTFSVSSFFTESGMFNDELTIYINLKGRKVDLDVRTVITSMLSSLVQSLNCQGQIQKTSGFTQQ